MSVAEGKESLQNMQNLINSWPVEDREDFNMRVEKIKFAARNDQVQKMAIMYAGMLIAVGRTAQ